jgi:acyl-CoA synthetase (AMP-forming)/AMP-acid ligase II
MPKGVMVTHGNLLNNERMIQTAFGTTGHATIGVGWLPVYHDMGLIGNVLHPGKRTTLPHMAISATCLNL